MLSLEQTAQADAIATAYRVFGELENNWDEPGRMLFALARSTVFETCNNAAHNVSQESSEVAKAALRKILDSPSPASDDNGTH